MSAAQVALFGDWNAQALSDVGRYSPAWIAAQTGLRVEHAGPGRHGNIDFVLTNVPVRASRRLGNGNARFGAGSDHDAILFTLWHHGALRVLLWNIERDRPVRVALAQLRDLIEQTDPDVIVLNEATQYVAGAGVMLADFRLVTGDTRGSSECAVLVKGGSPRVVQLSDDGWTTVTGHEHAPIFGAFVRIDGLHLGGIHMPPSVNWLRKGKGLPFGPARRVAVYVSAARKLVRIVRRWHAKAAQP